MPRNYTKIGYTPCQLEIAEWIKLGHTKMREDSQLRCYACTAKGESHNYHFVKHLIYNGRDLGDGRVLLNGNPNPPNANYTRTDQTRHSRFCGLIIEVKGQVVPGKGGKAKGMALGGG